MEKKRYQWIGSTDLKDHYGGKVNKYVYIKEAENPVNMIKYTNERSVSFEKFQTNMKYMFTRFRGNDEVLTEYQNI